MRSSKGTPRVGTDRRDIVDDLNRLMAEEAEACLRYLQMRFRLRGKESVAADRFFEDAVKETLEHATAIARQIRALGHIPALRITLALGGGPMRLETALAEALDVEQQALDAYKDLLPRVAGDPVLEEFLRRQVAVETEHVQEIRDFVRSKAAVKLVPRPKTGR
ncbi:MAG: ferritin-like domain-containing protein [Acidobacteria bacterium]|nr:ferritin-like domain-containing protein [Acidobacteriota bacterium]